MKREDIKKYINGDSIFDKYDKNLAWVKLEDGLLLEAAIGSGGQIPPQLFEQVETNKNDIVVLKNNNVTLAQNNQSLQKELDQVENNLKTWYGGEFTTLKEDESRLGEQVSHLAGEITQLKQELVSKNDIVTTNTIQDILETKTFKKVPASFEDPKVGTHLTNKRYVDNAIKQAQIGGGGEVDLSAYVRKDETLEQLCKVEDCPWAKDITRQIDSNGKILGEMWDKKKLHDEDIATQQWVKANFPEQVPSDQPQWSRADIQKVVRETSNEYLYSVVLKNNPTDDNNTFYFEITPQNMIVRNNPQLQPNAPKITLNYPTNIVSEGLEEEKLDNLTLTTEEWVIPKLHAINLIYNFQSSQIEKQSEDFVPYKYIVWNVKVKGWIDFLMKHWPKDELEYIKKWGRVSCFVSPRMIDIDWVRNHDGGTNYIDEHHTELIACSYDTNGDLILTIRVNGVADTTKYSQMINHLVLIVYKFGQALLVSNDPTIDDEVDKRPITEWKPKN